MTFAEYQASAMRTINRELSDDQLIVTAALGIAGEGGEIADIIKKWQFQGHDLDRAKLREETGDLMWYLALLMTGLDSSLNLVAFENIAKLRARYPDGFDSHRSINRED